MKCVDDELRRRLLAEGRSVREVANICGITEKGLRSWMHSNHITLRKPHVALDETRVRELFNAGVTFVRMAEEFDVSAQTVAQFCRDHGMRRLRPHTRGQESAQLDRDREARAANMRGIAADNKRAREAGLSYGKWRRKYG